MKTIKEITLGKEQFFCGVLEKGFFYGFRAGLESGFSDGYEEGYIDGYDEGYIDRYNEEYEKELDGV